MLHTRLSSQTIGILRRHNVLYVDKSMLVLNKCAGLVCQGTKSEKTSKRVRVHAVSRVALSD